jgi:hypothetical protein
VQLASNPKQSSGRRDPDEQNFSQRLTKERHSVIRGLEYTQARHGTVILLVDMEYFKGPATDPWDDAKDCFRHGIM